MASMKASARSSSYTLNAGISPRMIFANTLSVVVHVRSPLCRVRPRPGGSRCRAPGAPLRTAPPARRGARPANAARRPWLGLPSSRVMSPSSAISSWRSSGLSTDRRAGQLGVQGRELVLQFCSHCRASTADEAAILCENGRSLCGQSFSGLLTGCCAPSGWGCTEPASGRGLLLARQAHVVLLLELRNPGVVQAGHAEDRRRRAERRSSNRRRRCGPCRSRTACRRGCDRRSASRFANFSSGSGIDSSTRYALRPGPQTTTLVAIQRREVVDGSASTRSRSCPRAYWSRTASALAPMPMPAAAKIAANNKVFFMMRTPIVCTTSE